MIPEVFPGQYPVSRGITHSHIPAPRLSVRNEKYNRRGESSSFRSTRVRVASHARRRVLHCFKSVPSRAGSRFHSQADLLPRRIRDATESCTRENQTLPVLCLAVLREAAGDAEPLNRDFGPRSVLIAAPPAKELNRQRLSIENEMSHN